MHLTIAIPTYNRCEYLKKNIESFDKVRRPNGIKLSLTISNSASEDSTEAYLEKISKERQDIFLFNKRMEWNGGNYGYLSNTIPDDVDWVWFMGDDDYLSHEESLEKVCDLLLRENANADFGFVHACQARRSRDTGAVVSDTTFNLCNHFGYTEMLGWISSIIMRRQSFVDALQKVDARAQQARDEPALGNTHSAFFQASYIFEEIYWMRGAFIDSPLVDMQDQEMTEATRQRWQSENMGERYIYIIDDLQRLKSQGLPIKDLRNEFFRYHEYQIWDRFIIHQLNVLEAFGNGDDSELIKNSMARFVDNWGRISAIAGLLSDPVCKKQLTTIVENCIGLSNLFLETNFNPAVKELLLRQRELHTVSEYDFCIAYA